MSVPGRTFAHMIARLRAAGLGIALLVSAAMTVLGILVIAATGCGLFCGGRWLWREHRDRADARIHRRAEILARAEIQHRWYIAGDPRGTHGRYPPAAGAIRRSA
jgi:hypothetical protein